MTRYPLVVLSCCLVAMGAVSCSPAPQSKAVTGQSTPPGIRYEANVSAGGVAPPDTELKDARVADAAYATGGAGLFSSMNCDGCHGGGALGWVGPSLVDGRWRYGGADEEVFSSIYYGRPKGMPAYGGVIGVDGVWMLVAYLKSQPVPSMVPTMSYEDLDRAAPPTAAIAVPSPAAAPVAKTTDQMLVEYGCTACHALDRKVIGPSFVEVAAKYKGADVEKTLAQKIHDGGSGVWGTIPMAPNPQIPDQDLHTLVRWILARG